MKIKNMFKDDINRSINGVIQVEQEENNVIKQEVEEYVITSELKKHFNKFFSSYSDSFDHPTDNTGIWITGFFGSGKSHFIKMLSYLLENKNVDGKTTVEYFRDKYNDELSFMPIVKSTSVPTETILFNIGAQSIGAKDETAVLRVFTRVFYDHLGFYGSDVKLAKLEQFVTKQGKMDEFKAKFEEINGDDWISAREEYVFWEDDIIEVLQDVLGMSEDVAKHWFDGTEEVHISIDQLAKEVKEYVDSKPKGFRLLFMADEVGQFVGSNLNMLLDLQTIVERFGSVCRGQVWVVATGQEALDEMIKVRTDAFSRIMARFSVKLSLTSSSVGEVIEKRLLSKTDEAYENLEMVYNNNDSVLSNLYSLQTQKKDLKGYRSADEFARVFPFVPYQFIVMQNVFNETRKHGHAGQHQSSGERSMLNGFQESAQKIQAKDEFSLVPMYLFYDTLHSFLDTSIRSVIERAERAAKNNEGLKDFDVNLLKQLYLIRYIDDIPSNIENLTILMADDIRVDKQELRENVKNSLNTLINQNYVSRNGDLYMFLTDEEQDIARDIKNTEIDTSAIVSKLADIIFDGIYTEKKYRYNKYDFEFNKSVDSQNKGNSISDAMKLHFMTVAADPTDLQELKLITDSKERQAIIVLSDEYSYYENIETSLKIKKYIKQKNVNQLPSSVQKIITDKQTESNRLERQATDDVKKAIAEGKYYIDGEVVSMAGSDAVANIKKSMEYLVEHTYHSLNLIDSNYDSDADINAVLKGTVKWMDGLEPNKQACDEIEKYLNLQFTRNLPTSMNDIQSRYSSIPYGWREIDIAGVVAQLIAGQKVTIKYSGQNIQASDYRMVNFLRKKTEIGQVRISKRESISLAKMNQAKGFLREYFDVMDVPGDEDGLIEYIITNFTKEQQTLNDYYNKNATRHYPGYNTIQEALKLVAEVLNCKTDNIALVNKVCSLEDDLLDGKDDMVNVKNFFTTQKTLFDTATDYMQDVMREKDYFTGHDEVETALQLIKNIVTYSDNYNYSKIKDLNGAIATIKDVYAELIKSKKKELEDIVEQCFNSVKDKANEDTSKLSGLLNQARQRFETRKEEISRTNSLALLDSKKMIIFGDQDNYIQMMDKALKPVILNPKPVQPVVKKNTREFHRNVLFQTQTITSKEDIDKYVNAIKARLLSYLEDCDEIKIK